MVYGTNISIAFKDELGLYKIENTTLFQLSTMSRVFPVKDYKVQGKEISFKVKCPICDEYHHYIYHVNDLMRREIIIGGCETTSTPIFVLGNRIKVLNFINRYNEVNKQIYAML